jgi:hypothetical protein
MDNDHVDVREILNKFGDDIAGFRQRVEAMEGDIGFVKNRVSYHTSEIALTNSKARYHDARLNALESVVMGKKRAGGLVIFMAGFATAGFFIAGVAAVLR